MKTKKKNIILNNLEVESVAAEGKCVAHVDGQVVFLSKAAPGDIVDARVTKKKKAFMEAVPIHFHKKSKLRVEPFCEHYEACGGCKWQHLNYETQLQFKTQQVEDQLTRIGNLELPEVQPIIASEKTQLYRNKLEFTFTPRRWFTKEELDSGQELQNKGLGFHAPGRYDRIIDIDHCYLQPEPSNEIRLFVKFFAINHDMNFFYVRKLDGFLRNLIIRTTSIGEVMVILQVGENQPENIELICNALKENFPEITSINYVVNSKGNETFHDLEVVNYSGTPYITEEMEGIKFRIGPKSFFQTNSDQALKLYQETKKLAGLTGKEIVYDLYTGTGTIANFVARNAKKVIGVEYVPEAIEDAKVNSEINEINNTEFFAGDMKDIITDEFIIEHGQPDVIITDPPRAGMHEDVVQSILRASPAKIVYISCNPATQARDLSLMAEKYHVMVVQPVDMFPHTHHVENIVLLEKK